jgi:hypothetical protein
MHEGLVKLGKGNLSWKKSAHALQTSIRHGKAWKLHRAN